MLKQAMLLLIVSILILLGLRYIATALDWYWGAYEYAFNLIQPIFSKSQWGYLIQAVLVLTFLPLLLVSVPALIWLMLKNKKIPHIHTVLWALWLIAATLLVAQA